jgi:hypothetical protein
MMAVSLTKSRPQTPYRLPSASMAANDEIRDLVVGYDPGLETTRIRRRGSRLRDRCAIMPERNPAEAACCRVRARHCDDSCELCDRVRESTRQ